METTIPAGHVLRAPTADDAAAVAELLRAREVADLGEAEVTVADVRADWETAELELERDAWVVTDAGGSVVAYALVTGADIVVAVHPRSAGQGIGRELRSAAERRARDRGTRVLRQFVPTANTAARILLLEAGLVAGAPLLPHADRPQRRAAAAARPRPHVRRAARHGGGVASHPGRLRRRRGPPAAVARGMAGDRHGQLGWDPALWLLLHDAKGIVGAALGEKGEAGHKRSGIVTSLAVAHRARGQGHGRTLLLLLFDVFSAPGTVARRGRGARQHSGRGACVRVGRHEARPAGGALGEGHRCLSWSDSPRAREEGRPRHRHRVHARGPLPASCSKPVQVCVGEEVVVLDLMNGDLDTPAPLAAVLADPAVEVVLHAGRQDVAILRRAWGTTFANVFDTQVAAGFAGFSAQAGYTGLLHDVLQIRLSKSASFTRWDARPLTPEQLRYAREDVEHLLPLADEPQRRLTERGRLEGARGVPGDRRGDRRARSRGGVAAAAADLRARLRAAALWRASWPPGASAPPPPRTASVGSVVRDLTLVESLLGAGQHEGAEPDPRRAGPDVVRRRARDLIAAVERGLAAPPIRLEEGERLATDPVDGPTIALAEALVRARAQEAASATS